MLEAMNSQIAGLRVAGTVFGIMSLAQLSRLLTRAEVQIGGYLLPLWPSVLGFLVAGGLAIWMWKLSSSARK
jgi:hypothetical protein